MKCTDCGYHWKDENDEFPCCHYDAPFPAPCEQEYDDFELEEDDEDFEVIYEDEEFWNLSNEEWGQ